MGNQVETLPLPDAAAFCSVKYAAAKLGRDERTIRRWVAEGILTAYSPRVAPGEEKRTMLWVPQVTELREALAKVKGNRARA
jgi:hypothetical protein